MVGLLTDAQGEAVSVEVFRGNTSEVSTLTAQVRKLAQAFGCRRITLVGDRGLIKQVGIQALQAKNFYFISAITKAQIETLLKQEVIEMALFDQPLGEVELAAEAKSASTERRSLRYILKRNPVRAQELAHNRQPKKAALEQRLHDCNQKLARSRRAQLAVARRELLGYLAKLKLEGGLTVHKRSGQRQFYLIEDQAVLAEQSKLDGCYVIRTDLPAQAAEAQTVRERYRDLVVRFIIACMVPKPGDSSSS